MATIVLSKRIALHISAMRSVLTKYLPLFSWQCGEDDSGAEGQVVPFGKHTLISGRTGGSVVFVELTCREERLNASAPPHGFVILIGAPTTDQTAIADRLRLIIASCLMMADREQSACQLREGGNWLTLDEVVRATDLVIKGEPISIADGLGRPAAAFGGGAPARPTAGTNATPTHACPLETANKQAGAELTSMVVLADRQLPVDGASLERMARDIDPDGGWRLEQHNGQAVLVSRSALVGVCEMNVPVPPQYYMGNWARSHWFRGDRGAVERHVRHVNVKAMLDTRSADYTTVRQTAKIVTLAACWIARQPGALAIVNLDVGTIFEAGDGRKFLDILTRDELPVALWTWTAPHSLTDGSISLSTSGLAAFLGHELETWAAPLPRDDAATMFGDMIRYLLDKGPVIGHGDSAGRTADDKAARCFLGPSRAERPQKVEALFIEFDETRPVEPRADVTAPAMPRPTPDADGKTRIIPAALWEGKSGAFLKAIGVSPDDASNILPTEEDYVQRIEASRVAMAARCDDIEAKLRTKHPQATVRPYFALGELCWQGELYVFLVKLLEMLPYDDWNMLALAKDERTMALTGLPLHPGSNLEIFDRQAAEFAGGLLREHRALMATLDRDAPDFMDRLRDADLEGHKARQRAALISWAGEHRQRILAFLGKHWREQAPAPTQPPAPVPQRRAGGFGRKGL